MSSTYEMALKWADLNHTQWKIIGQFSLPSDPNIAGTWIYFPANATDKEINAQRDFGHLLTTISRIDGVVCILAKRPKKKHNVTSDGPKGFKASASWM